MTGYWVEEKDGVNVLCFKFRRHGQYFVHRLSLEAVKKILQECPPLKRDTIPKVCETKNSIQLSYETV